MLDTKMTSFILPFLCARSLLYQTSQFLYGCRLLFLPAKSLLHPLLSSHNVSSHSNTTSTSVTSLFLASLRQNNLFCNTK